MSDLEPMSEVKVVRMSTAEKKQIQESLINYAPRIFLNFLVPFLAQLGFGSGVGVAAKRAALIGSSGVAADLAGRFAVALSGDHEAAVIGEALLSPIIAGGIYTAFQEIYPINSQGTMSNFTISTLSIGAAHGMSNPTRTALLGLLSEIRLEKKLQ